MTRKTAIIVLSALLGITVIWLVAEQYSTWKKSATETGTGSAARSDLPTGEAKRLQTGLTSSDPAVFNALWLAHPPSLPAQGTTVEFIDGTFVSRGNYGRVDATITTGDETSHQRLLLLRRDGHWKINTTEEVQ